MPLLTLIYLASSLDKSNLGKLLKDTTQDNVYDILLT